MCICVGNPSITFFKTVYRRHTQVNNKKNVH
jgi:hypothetical protein